MLQFLSQQTILFYTMALICAWGVISQVVLRSMYGNLLRDVRRQGMAKGKFMKQLRQRYQNVCRMKQNTVNAFNTEAFIRKNLLEYRLFGGSLHTWKRMAQMAAILCAALGAVGWYISQPQAVGGMRQTYLTGTLLMEGISLLIFGVLDTGFAKQSLEITLQDELDNVLVLHASCFFRCTGCKIFCCKTETAGAGAADTGGIFKTGKSGGNGKMQCIVRRSGSFC